MLQLVEKKSIRSLRTIHCRHVAAISFVCLVIFLVLIIHDFLVIVLKMNLGLEVFEL